MKPLVFLLAFPALLFALPATAQVAGDWTLGIGAHQVSPTSNNGSLAGNTLDLDIGGSARPTITAEYFFTEKLGLEVLASYPFQHDISIDGLGKVGTTKHLPPTFSLQYHFNSQGNWSPFLGAGVNFTTFFGEDTRGALQGSDLKLGNSWGLAAHAGLDIRLSPKNAVRVDVRWIDIDSDVKLDGATLGTANIDPMVFGAAWVRTF